MRLWILSDQLIRGWDLQSGDTRPDFDVLVVAGDLIPRMERGVKWLAQSVTDRPVVYVAGNHEPYGRDIDLDLEKASRRGRHQHPRASERHREAARRSVAVETIPPQRPENG